MKKIQLISIVLCMTLMMFFAACSGSEETKKDESTTSGEYTKTDKDDPSVPKTETPPTGTAKKSEQELPTTEKDLPKSDTPPPKIETPSTTPQQIPPPITTAPKTGQIMWSVQIGAFKNEPGALQVANEARTKFSQPIYKDFDPVTGFWKVNIGSFATRDQATKFKSDVQAQGYPDAFCVEVRR